MLFGTALKIQELKCGYVIKKIVEWLGLKLFERKNVFILFYSFRESTMLSSKSGLIYEGRA
jgi:hypothetical protein